MMGTCALDLERSNKPSVYCADDNPMVTEALRRYIERSPDFDWIGGAEDADQLIDEVSRRGCPDIVLLDIDMPGRDPFEAIGDLAEHCANTRVLMYSGMVKRDLIDRAIEAGAWGYVSKADGEAELFAAMRKAMAGELGFSPEVQAVYSA
jgi:DNA-binding NarL/FixJ family response regulator